ncbi:hypothetical protein LIER_07982 [Lithospermum erythrorhizon]|uniref:Uncharacterized protein n=1 Tax=Lithospermum erythrorhizon TaxID=34254 RepID=A0AAV3PA64_LITER
MDVSTMRLVPGHARMSHGLHYAQLAGVPEEVIKRPTYVLGATRDSKQFEREWSQKISSQDQRYKDGLEKLVSLDFT